MTDSEKLAWALKEIEIRADEDAAIARGADEDAVKRERAFRRTRSRMTRTEIRELLAQAAMEWAA